MTPLKRADFSTYFVFFKKKLLVYICERFYMVKGKHPAYEVSGMKILPVAFFTSAFVKQLSACGTRSSKFKMLNQGVIGSSVELYQ